VGVERFPAIGGGGNRSTRGACAPNHQICFTNASKFRQPRRVGKLLAIPILLLTALSCLRAQDQERKLVDRLLRPDMTLQNSEQKKKFTADGTSINKKASVGTFYVGKKSNSKTFSGTRELSTQQFSSQPFRGSRGAFENSTQQTAANSRRTYPTQSASGPRDAPQSDKKINSRAYAGNRPFLDEGKSQKSLNRQNAPLTIDQVRELLNKNK
jgi:hypothetical protein